MRYNLIFIFLVTLLTSCLKEDGAIIKPLYTNNPLQTEFDREINKILKQYASLSSTGSVSIGVFKSGEEHYYGYGEVEIGTGITPDSLTIYEIGSITKTFTALMAIDYLHSNGLSKETPVNTLLPKEVPLLEHGGVSVKMVNLLNHTSGLPRLPSDFELGMDIGNPYKHYDSSRVYNYLKSYHFDAVPGTKWEYSNLGMGLVGLILERQTKMTFEQILYQKICQPLDLPYTKITFNGTDSLSHAIGYNRYGIKMPYWDDMNAFKGAGAIRSNARDLIRYGRQILNPNDSPLKNQIEDCLSSTYYDANVEMASGWVIQNANNDKSYLHDGGTGGFTSLIFINTSQNVVLVLLFSNETSNSVTDLFNPLIALVLN